MEPVIDDTIDHPVLLFSTVGKKDLVLMDVTDLEVENFDTLSGISSPVLTGQDDDSNIDFQDLIIKIAGRPDTGPTNHISGMSGWYFNFETTGKKTLV
jgi:hypothetical protein